jgi:TPR repeat protein/Flp pilus assembly protein TadD
MKRICLAIVVISCAPPLAFAQKGFGSYVPPAPPPRPVYRPTYLTKPFVPEWKTNPSAYGFTSYKYEPAPKPSYDYNRSTTSPPSSSGPTYRPSPAPTYTPSPRERARALYAQQRWSEAEIAFRDALRSSPADADLHGPLGWVLHYLRKDADSEREFRAALGSRTSEPSWSEGLAYALQGQSKWGEAESAYRAALRLSPQNPYLHGNLATVLDEIVGPSPSPYSKSVMSEAEREYRVALQYQPTEIAWNDGLAYNLFGQKKWREAEAAYRSALRLQPNLPHLHGNLGRVLYRREKYAEAESEFRTGQRSDPLNPLWNLLVGMALEKQEKWADAEAAYQSALRLNPNDADAHTSRGLLLIRRGELENGNAEVRRGIQLKPDLEDPVRGWYSSAAWDSYKERKWLESEAILRAGLQMWPKKADLNLELGFVELGLGRGDPSLGRAVLKAVGWGDYPRSATAALQIYFASRQQHHDAEALAILQEAGTYCGTNWPYPVIPFLQGYITAEQLLAIASGNSAMAKAKTYLGMHLLLSGQSEEALELFRWVAQNGSREFNESYLAIAEIELLERRGIAKASASTRVPFQVDLYEQLVEAVRGGQTVDAVSALLKRVTNVNPKGSKGYLVLSVAAEGGDTDIVLALLEKGADVHARDFDDKTALHYAAMEGYTDVVRILLERKADINARDFFGRTPLMEAAYWGHSQTVRILMERGADVNAKTTREGGQASGQTALMNAADNGRTDVVRALLEKGADANLKNEYGKTALSLAEAAHAHDVVVLLKRAGARDANELRRSEASAAPTNLSKFEKTRSQYFEAAEKGDAEAQFWMGVAYVQSQPPDFAKAAQYYRKAAAQNYALAITNLALLYQYGLGVEKKDPARVFELYNQAAKLGEKGAEVTVGNSYYYGEGVSRDLVQAREWWRKAAQHGDALGMGHYAASLLSGEGGPPDFTGSYLWYLMAERYGCKDCGGYALSAAGKMTAQELEKANALWRIMPGFQTLVSYSKVGARE